MPTAPISTTISLRMASKQMSAEELKRPPHFTKSDQFKVKERCQEEQVLVYLLLITSDVLLLGAIQIIRDTFFE